jgi:hypothetical protein
MSRTIRSAIGVGIATTAAVGLVASGIGAAAGAPHARSSLQATPKLVVTITKHGLSLAGPTKFAPGRVELVLKAVGGDREVELARFKTGYTFKDLRADLGTFGASQQTGTNVKGGLKALNHAVNHTTLFGGLDAVSTTASASIVLPSAGTYVLWNDSTNGPPANAKTLTVSGPVAKRAAVHSTATVTATTAKRFTGATVIPAHGTLTFKNASTNSPHMLVFIHVKPGTTRKQVVDFAASNSQTPPSWFLPGNAVSTDVVSPGHSETFNTHMPAGTYAELCFFPDLQTGMPHAAMGMVRMITAK